MALLATRLATLLAALMMASACARTIDPKATSRAKISYDIAVASLNEGNTRAALSELLKAEAADPNLPQVHHALGLVYHAMQRRDEALQHYRRAITLKPDFSEAHNNFGTLLIDVGQYDAAIDELKLALGDILYATPSLAEGNMGWAYYRKGDTEQATRHLHNAVAINPKFCRGYEWLARIGLDHDDAALVVKSGERFQRYCAADKTIAGDAPPDYLRQMRYYLGLGQLKQGDLTAARATFSGCATAESEEQPFGSKCALSLRTLR